MINRDCPHCGAHDIWPDRICGDCHPVIFSPVDKQYPRDRESMSNAEIQAAVCADLDSGHE